MLLEGDQALSHESLVVRLSDVIFDFVFLKFELGSVVERVEAHGEELDSLFRLHLFNCSLGVPFSSRVRIKLVQHYPL